MNFKKCYISATLVVYLIKLGQLSEDSLSYQNKKIKRVKDVIPENLHQEFMFVVQNTPSKKFGKNKDWKIFIQNLNFYSLIQDENFDTYVNDFITEIIMYEYKLYETGNSVNENIHE